MKELSTKGMFFNDLDQAERDTLVAVAILQIMHAQPRFDASPNQDGGNVISVYTVEKSSLVLSEYVKGLDNHVRCRYVEKIAVIGIDPSTLDTSHFDPL